MEQFIAVCRDGAQVEFSPDYCRRVDKSRQLVERWVDEEKVMYGVTTGFGAPVSYTHLDEGPGEIALLLSLPGIGQQLPFLLQKIQKQVIQTV